MRLPLRSTVFASLLALGLSACAGPERLPDTHHVLAQHQQLVLGAQPRLALTYEGAQDSRCPRDARCVWAGQVAYRFTLRIDNVAQGFWLAPGKPGFTAPALRGARIELDHHQQLPALAAQGDATDQGAAMPVAINIYGR